MKLLNKIFVIGAIGASLSASEKLITVARLQIGTNTYESAQIRKAGPNSVIIRHQTGFFSTAITNLPRNIQTNFPTPAAPARAQFVPGPDVVNFIKENPEISPGEREQLLTGEKTLAESRETILDRINVNKNAWKRVDELKAQRQKEDEEFARKNPKLFQAIQEAIRDNKIIPGMRRRDVLASWGVPHTTREVATKQGTASHWSYERTTNLIASVSINVDDAVEAVETREKFRPGKNLEPAGRGIVPVVILNDPTGER